MSDKKMCLLQIMMALYAQYYLVLKNEMPLMIELDILQDQKAVLHRFFSYNYAKIKIDSDDDLSLEETLNLYNVVILIKSILNKNKNHYCYDILLEKCSYQLAKK